MKRTLIFAFIIILAVTAWSQEQKTTLDGLVSLALERNPKLRALRDAAESRRTRIASQGALPDPVVGFSLKNIGLSEITVGEEMMSGIGFSIVQAIPFPGKLRLKSEIASKEALVAEARLRLEELTLVREIKELYANLFYYEKSLALLEEKKGVLVKASKLAEIKYSVGEGIQSDIFKAQVEISGLEEMILTMDQMSKTTKANINSLLDFPSDRPLGSPEEIPVYEFKGELNALIEAAVKNSPMLRERELMIEQGEKEVEMARKEFYPNFMIQAGKDFKGPLPDMYEIMVGVEIPLFYKKKQANLLEESRLNLSSAKNSYGSARNDVSFMVNENFLMAKTSEDLIKLYKERIIPQATLALDSSLANYQVGRVDFLMLLSDINSLFSFEMDYYKNLRGLWISAARVEELTTAELLK
jgi:outer membrane protein TolC